MNVLAECEHRGLRLTPADLADCLRETYPDGTYPDGSALDAMTYLFGAYGITHLIDWALKEQRGEFSMTAQAVANVRARLTATPKRFKPTIARAQAVPPLTDLAATLRDLESPHLETRVRAGEIFFHNFAETLAGDLMHKNKALAKEVADEVQRLLATASYAEDAEDRHAAAVEVGRWFAPLPKLSVPEALELLRSALTSVQLRAHLLIRHKVAEGIPEHARARPLRELDSLLTRAREGEAEARATLDAQLVSKRPPPVSVNFMLHGLESDDAEVRQEAGKHLRQSLAIGFELSREHPEDVEHILEPLVDDLISRAEAGDRDALCELKDRTTSIRPAPPGPRPEPSDLPREPEPA
jgi:hypothetical protein